MSQFFERSFNHTMTKDHTYHKGGAPPIQWLEVRLAETDQRIGIYQNKNPKSAAWECVSNAPYENTNCLWATNKKASERRWCLGKTMYNTDSCFSSSHKLPRKGPHGTKYFRVTMAHTADSTATELEFLISLKEETCADSLASVMSLGESMSCTIYSRTKVGTKRF